MLHTNRGLKSLSHFMYWKAGEVHVQGMIHEVNNVHSVSG